MQETQETLEIESKKERFRRLIRGLPGLKPFDAAVQTRDALELFHEIRALERRFASTHSPAR